MYWRGKSTYIALFQVIFLVFKENENLLLLPLAFHFFLLKMSNLHTCFKCGLFFWEFTEFWEKLVFLEYSNSSRLKVISFFFRTWKMPKGVCVTGSCKRRYIDPLLVIHHYLPINTFSKMHSAGMPLVAARTVAL